MMVRQLWLPDPFPCLRNRLHFARWVAGRSRAEDGRTTVDKANKVKVMATDA